MDDANVSPLDTFDPSGHWICYGPSESGKTTFARHIINRIVRDKKVSWDNVFVFCSDEAKYQHEPVFSNVYTNWDTSDGGVIDQIKRVSRSSINFANGEGGAIILFDDFNEYIPDQDKVFEKLFASGRHLGIRYIIASHSVTFVSSRVRENIKYAGIMPNIPDKHQLIHVISKLFGGQDWKKIENATKALTDEGGEFRILVLRYDGRMFYDDVDIKEDPYHKLA